MHCEGVGGGGAGDEEGGRWAGGGAVGGDGAHWEGRGSVTQ